LNTRLRIPYLLVACQALLSKSLEDKVNLLPYFTFGAEFYSLNVTRAMKRELRNNLPHTELNCFLRSLFIIHLSISLSSFKQL